MRARPGSGSIWVWRGACARCAGWPKERAVEIAVSSERSDGVSVDRVDVGRGWQGLELRDDARYVRLTLLPTDDGGELPAIAEAAVYGAERAECFFGTAGRRPANAIGTGSRVATGNQFPSRKRRATTRRVVTRGDGTPVPGGRVRISAEPGETRCSGDRERCEARQGEVSVEDDCEREGTCTIDVRADGGTAVCDAAGGDETKPGDGEGRRGGRAGRCEAVANGGAVASVSQSVTRVGMGVAHGVLRA